MHTAYAVTDPAYVGVMERLFNDGPADEASNGAFEILYEVTGFDRMNLDGVLVHSGELDYQRIWGGELPQALR